MYCKLENDAAEGSELSEGTSIQADGIDERIFEGGKAVERKKWPGWCTFFWGTVTLKRKCQKTRLLPNAKFVSERRNRSRISVRAMVL